MVLPQAVAYGLNAYGDVFGHAVFTFTGLVATSLGGWIRSARTRERRAYQRSLAAEQRFRSVLESAPDAILITDAKGRITLVNRQTEQLFGYSREELIGEPIELLIPAPKRVAHEKLREDYHRDPKTRAMGVGRTLFAVSKDGRQIPVEIGLSPGTVAGEISVTASIRDISDRLKAEEQLRIFASVVESSNDFIGICKPDMTPIYVNDAGRRMVGLDSVDEVMRTRVFDYFMPEDLPLIEREAVPSLSKNHRWSGECRFRNFKTGEPIHTIWNVFLVNDPEGKTLAWATISPNLNKLKQTEEKIRASLEEKEVLLREIHHRVKNNLNIVSSLLGLQAMGLEDGEIRDALIQSQNRVASMALIHEKLYQSKNIARLDFGNYVRDLVFAIYHSFGKDPESIRPEITIEKAGLDIDTAIPCSLIINELVSNSLKHGFPERKTGHVFISLKRVEENPEKCELAVSDDGVGFPADFKLEKARSLGLKLVHSLTKQIGGTVVECARGKGSSFKIQFSPKRRGVKAYA